MIHFEMCVVLHDLQKAQRAEILELISALESLNPVPAPMATPDILEGSWKLLFTTIAIQGSKRTKLGLRQFVSLGELTQGIDVQNHQAVSFAQFGATSVGIYSLPTEIKLDAIIDNCNHSVSLLLATRILLTY